MENELLENKIKNLVKELIEQTRAKELSWISAGTEEIDEPGITVTLAFQATFKGKTLRMFHFRYKDDRAWDEDVRLEIVDEFGRAVWDFPGMPELWQLYEVVRFKVAGIDELLEPVS